MYVILLTATCTPPSCNPGDHHQFAGNPPSPSLSLSLSLYLSSCFIPQKPRHSLSTVPRAGLLESLVTLLDVLHRMPTAGLLTSPLMPAGEAHRFAPATSEIRISQVSTAVGRAGFLEVETGRKLPVALRWKSRDVRVKGTEYTEGAI